jgi:hypothetical protein
MESISNGASFELKRIITESVRSVVAPALTQPEKVGSGEWMDALTEEVELMKEEAITESSKVRKDMVPFYDGEVYALGKLLERMMRRVKSASISDSATSG